MSTVLWKKFVILFIFYMKLLRHFIPRNDKRKIPQSVIASVARQSRINPQKTKRKNLAR